MTENFRDAPWRWGASLYFAGAAVAALNGTTSFAMLAIAVVGLALFAPPLQRLTKSRYGFAITGWKLVPIFILMFAGMATANSYSREYELRKVNEEKQRAAAAAIQAEQKYFVDHKVEIIARVESLVQEKNFDEAIAHGQKYWKISKDATLRAAIDSAIKTQALARVSTRGATDTDKATAYAALAKLEPDNKRYQKEAERYAVLRKAEQKKMADERAMAARLAERRTRLEKQFSPWDGSHPAVERRVKQAMNNPDSYDHVETSYVMLPEGMRVTMTFRGTNGFGGIVPNTVVATVSDSGDVVSMGRL